MHQPRRVITFLSMAIALVTLAGTGYAARYSVLSSLYRKHWLTDPRGEPRLGVLVKEALEGVMVLDVTNNSSAAQAGLQKGDLLLQVNKTPIKEFTDVGRVLDQCLVEDTVSIMIQRGNQHLEVKTVLKSVY